MSIGYKRGVNRREFNTLCAALGSSMAMKVVSSAAQTNNPMSENVMRSVKLPDGVVVPALGQGSASLGQDRHPESTEEEAMRAGLALGMTVIDTAELYGDGAAEKFIGRAIAGQRQRVFLISKLHPSHVTDDAIVRACDGSLERLGTDYLDLYLLHWRERATNLSTVVVGFEKLRATGKIRAWGVSNFGVKDLQQLFRIRDGNRCAANEVLYNVDKRGIERNVLPWCTQHGMPVIAYTPLGGASVLREPTLTRIAKDHGCSAAAVALAWTIRSGHVIAIPESGSPAHVKENAAAASLRLTQADLDTIDKAHPLALR